jgi:hypothetical protein
MPIHKTQLTTRIQYDVTAIIIPVKTIQIYKVPKTFDKDISAIGLAITMEATK